MNITTTATSNTTTTTSVKTPEAETENSTRIQPVKPLSFSNGVLKRHQPLHLLGNPQVVVTYKECLKNHAASLGGHAVDGCGEFMPSPTAVPTDPTSLKCAACGCHRNFHRREPEEPHQPTILTPTAQHVIEYQPHHRHHPPPPPPPLHGGAGGNSSSPNSPSPPPISSSYYPSAPHMLLALSAGLSAPPPENNTSLAAVNTGAIAHPNGRKRFRTKFTQDQKEKMYEFAEKVGWKIQKRDEDLISDFCNEIGVDRGVLKVWMHNNKSTLSKREGNTNGGISGVVVGIGGENGVDATATAGHYHHQFNGGGESESNLENHHQLHSSDRVSAAHVVNVTTNGSSSSS
ncbi:hypothetical protein RJ640_025685 [Escallonia rubra]|uniref:ZF-HD dimerization-type domain-containing protein n=1 Tax=Escallonia rubra TaxID=112253 RepID=A0AA88S9A3_9ASTE|nr:hypothetical protein RJ640_025685 [Escallonia rubra]